MKTVGPGVYEIRVKDDASNNYRVIYIAKYEEAVYVLHCFHKTTPQTAQTDIDLAKSRLRDLNKKRAK
ncbi:phage derived Gp49-like protein DUF891 [Xylophilus ampelinus]|uniref:Phage derived Gp49-like protein DUF891 n=2 Tax=Xylophilus ampelinus TaxID=54067 RepID=A0A318SPL3_9BURK|nr:phage derived Gp49-like protein DUF891 [Xylophilus ampelinus]